MKLAVIGATGPTGRLVVDQALARGHEVIAYVRNPASLSPRPGLTVVKGALEDQASFARAIRGAEALVCCLGTHSVTGVRLMQQSIPLVVQAMREAEVPRLVLLSAYGVGKTASTASWIARALYATLVASVYRDKAASEAFLEQSGMPWTGVYPVILTDGPLAEDAAAHALSRVRQVRGLPKVPRANVARALLDAAEDPRVAGKQLLVAPSASVVLD